MGNETEKDFQPQQPKPSGTVDQSKKNPSQGGQSPNRQDPYKKNPSHSDDSGQRDGEEGSEQVEKRRAS